MRKHTPFIAVFALTIFWLNSSLSGQETAATERFTITGTVVDEDGNPVPDSAVIPLSEHGVPLNETTGLPVTFASIAEQGDTGFVLFTKTDEAGVFSFDLLPGKYKLAAQSWLDEPGATELLGKNGDRLRIDGRLEIEFGNEMEASEQFEIRPLGTATVLLKTQEASDMLLVSTEPLACDIILGFVALTGDFWGGLIGGARMDGKEILISGLPAGELQFFSFVNDNNGGVGASRATAIEGRVVDNYLGVLAGWSNGHRTPPGELEELVDYLAEHADELHRINERVENLQKEFQPDPDKPRSEWIESQTRLAERLNDQVELANGDTRSLADVWAAIMYLRLRDR